MALYLLTMVNTDGNKTDYVFTPEKKNGRFAGMRLMEIHGDDRPSCYYDPAVHTPQTSHYCSHLWRARKFEDTYQLISPFGDDRKSYMTLLPIDGYNINTHRQDSA